MPEPEFHFPPDLPYRCRAHGDCCREDWNIPIDPASLAVLQRQLEGAGETGEHFTERSGETTFCRDQGACVFQGGDNLCRVHQRWGEETKPLICRQFPYLFVKTPVGITVGYSFVCTSVRTEHCFNLAETVENPEDVRRIYALSLERDPRFHVREAESPVRLDEGIDLSWRAYEALEMHLINLLNREDLPLRERLVAGHVFSHLLALTLRELHPGGVDAAHEEAFLGVMAALAENHYARPVRIGGNTKPALAVGRFIRGMYLTFDRINRTARAEGGRPGRLAGMKIYARSLQDSGRPRLTDSARATLDHQATPWLRHVLRRRHLAVPEALFLGDTVRRRYAGLVVAYSLLEHFHARLCRDTNPEEAASEAVRKVERDFVLHTKFRGPLGSSRDAVEAGLPGTLFSILLRAIERKNFPRSVVG